MKRNINCLGHTECPTCKKEHFKKNTFIVDLDGTLCVLTPEGACKNFENKKPLKNRVALIKQLKKEGANIIIQTGRSESGRKATEVWLDKYGITYSALLMEKSSRIFVLDDRMVMSSLILMERNKDTIPEIFK